MVFDILPLLLLHRLRISTLPRATARGPCAPLLQELPLRRSEFLAVLHFAADDFRIGLLRRSRRLSDLRLPLWLSLRGPRLLHDLPLLVSKLSAGVHLLPDLL